MNCRIAFEELAWQTIPAGLRFKVHAFGSWQLRLLEFTPEVEHPHWCTTGHVGYVIEGSMSVEFPDRVVTYFAGDGLVIPAGDSERHRPRALSERVRLIFMEEILPALTGAEGQS
jgi:mannose-6-phosphate isomerase-like protein (cupin superfamily)